MKMKTSLPGRHTGMSCVAVALSLRGSAARDVVPFSCCAATTAAKRAALNQADFNISCTRCGQARLCLAGHPVPGAFWFHYIVALPTFAPFMLLLTLPRTELPAADAVFTAPYLPGLCRAVPADLRYRLWVRLAVRVRVAYRGVPGCLYGQLPS